jgi:hypothetical protein
MVVVKNVNSTMYKVDIVHDPVLLEYDGDPNLQKNKIVTTQTISMSLQSTHELKGAVCTANYQLSCADVIVLHIVFY